MVLCTFEHSSKLEAGVWLAPLRGVDGAVACVVRVVGPCVDLLLCVLVVVGEFVVQHGIVGAVGVVHA